MKEITYTYNGNENKANVIERVGFIVVEELVKAIADNVFVDGVYMPYRYNYIFAVLIMKTYTDIDVDNMTTEEIYTMIDTTDFLSVLYDAIDPAQLSRISTSAHELIKFRLDKYPIENVVSNVKDVFEKLKNAINTLAYDENVQKELENIVEQIKSK